MSWADLYAYFSKEVEGGVSAKSVDALFKSLDRSSRGSVTLQEFTEVVTQRLSSLRAEKELEMRLAERVPRIHVVPGSNRLNCVAKTEVFRVQVVTRPMVRELGQVWAEMDADRDGRVSIADLRRYFTRTQPGLLPFLTSIFRAIEGKGRTGMVTFQHLLKALYPEASPADLRTLQAMSTSRKSRLAAAAAEAAANDKLLAEIQGVFSVFDDDQRGELDEEEFVSAMELTGHTKEEAKGMFKAIDAEGSGVVRWAAFRKWYTSSYSRFMEEAQRKMLEEGAE
ncbi:hypothetical protein VOLCADRAFT_99591 [Volvox carteri f. nagariensis]|uniref:EF-hand domain-containing protein n=1 Tax=Volvox carteri f. nagariensis TaxID=3068 RepID=D8UI48_VOLCA|nr:uncharacterized protein VOLCADRAFT_99591 [Volvox carteri f. nagariensis]EFJ40632.1 hypothetical protein VOLCADRAFT_99591 [Volvox carteri f. nagariensis]|eukprot:XP_002958339.1 hypothetical protein VOLCADRAFT_99591 [Volvox carteri f. nagariensis]